MTEWRHSRWGDLATLEYGKSLRGYQNAAGQYPVFGTNGPIGHGPKPLCEHPGVIIGRKGAYRGVHYSDRPFWVIDTAFYLEPKADIDLKWAYYELLTHDINAMDSGSAIPSTSRAAFYALPVRVPPLDEQRRIAHTLGGLDDKIDLNRRMNHTLESIARAIFKSWFVDFDPVRKKTEGKTGAGSGLPPSLAALFPSRLVDSEFGDVPEGWQVRPLSDVLLEVNERVGDALVPEYSSTNEGLQPRSERFKKTLSASSAKNKLVRRGNLVFGLSRRVLNFGLMRDSVGSVSSAYKVFAVDEAAVLPDLMERLIRSAPAYYFNVVSASSREGQSVSSDALRELMFVQPIMPVQEAFYRFTAPLGGLGDVLEEETRVSTDLRDTLLPHMLDREPAWRLSP